MNSGLTGGFEKTTVSFPYGLTPFRGRTFPIGADAVGKSGSYAYLASLSTAKEAFQWVKKCAQSAQILYYSVSRCMKKEVDKEKMMWWALFSS